MAKIKIPSKYILISGNHIYKGYYAEYRSRLRQGEFLIVHLGCNGHEAAIPIGNVVFIMPDGRFLQYQPINNGLSLFEVGNEEAGEIILINEEPDSPSTDSPLYIPGENPNIGEGQNDEEYEEDIDIEVTGTKRKASKTSSEKYAIGFDDVEKVLRQEIPLDSHPITEFISIFFKLVGFNMDNVAINSHSTILQGYLKNSLLDGIVINIDLYKTFVIAYVFIYINNLNVGYPIAYPGCKITPNDNPGFLLCIALKSKFIKVDNPINITYQITALLKIMGTKIVPASNEIAIYNRFSLLRISDSSYKKKSTKKPTLMRFPLLNKYENIQISTAAKNTVIEKLPQSIKTENKDVLDSFKSNFDYYISGPGYRQIVTNPTSRKSIILLPYIREYKKRVEFEKDKFYNNMSKTTISNNIPKTDKLTENLKDKIISELNSKIIDKLNDKTISVIDHNALQYIVNNSAKIINLTANDLKDLNMSLISSTTEQEAILSSIINYKKMYDNLLEKFKKDYNYRLDLKKATFYKQKYSSEMDFNFQDLQKRNEQIKKRKYIDTRKNKVFEGDRVISEIKDEIIDILNSGKYSKEEYVALHYLLNNFSNIVDISDNEFKTYLKTNLPNESSTIINTIKIYRDKYEKILQKNN